MKNKLNEIFEKHREWLESEGESGETLVLEGISSDQLNKKQLSLLTSAVITECIFENVNLNGFDLYHTEMYACEFQNVSFCKTQFIKSEINDSKFVSVKFESANFAKAEFFDNVFLKCDFENVIFINIGIWNARFESCTIINADFENAYLENVIFQNSKFINPVNLEKATKLEINVGTLETPVILSGDESIQWIRDHLMK